VASAAVPGTAVIVSAAFAISPGPADIDNAGGLSPYGTMAQGGNVWEWVATDQDLVNDSPDSIRGIRGGFW
jgi:hypothetical protein